MRKLVNNFHLIVMGAIGAGFMLYAALAFAYLALGLVAFSLRYWLAVLSWVWQPA